MKLIQFGIFVATVTVLAACTDEKIVYVDREPFNPPIDSINGFLGYYNVGLKQTSCGNCHVNHQGKWKQTLHANAWADLQNSGHAQQLCEGCHSVSENGNAVEGAAGYDLVRDSAYHDVQCENCHGPGFTHASEPDVGPVPLARLAASVDDTTGTCGECHAGSHHPFVEEWAQSGHAVAVTSPATRAGCNACHEARGILKAWGVDAKYIESGDSVTAANALGQTCAVCHDPHGGPNAHQLRWPIASLDPTQQLCMKCHLRRVEPEPGSSRGNTPHAPQGAVLLGEAGYQNPAFLDTTLLNTSRTATHASLTANPRLCAGCHLYSFSTTDAQGNAFTVTGHLFRPIPCYDANGLPSDTVTNCAFTPAARSFKACAVSGCHITEDQAALVLSVARGRMRQLSGVMWQDLDGDLTIDAFPTDGGYLAKIKANTTDLNPSDAIVSAADGAEFNLRLVGENAVGFLYVNGDKSHSVHNPFVAEALLRASILELEFYYSTRPWWTPLPPAVQQIMDGPMGVSGKVPYPYPQRASSGTASR